MITLFLIAVKDAVYDFGRTDRTGCSYAALLAALAAAFIKVRDTLADDAEIVQIRLDTVVRAAADCDLKFVRKRNVMVALVKTMVNLLGKCEGVEQAVLAGRSLAGDNRTDLCAGTAGLQTCLCDVGLKCLDIFIWNPLYLHGKAGRKRHISISIFFCSFCQARHLCCIYLSIYCDDTGRKIVRPLII